MKYFGELYDDDECRTRNCFGWWGSQRVLNDYILVTNIWLLGDFLKTSWTLPYHCWNGGCLTVRPKQSNI